jgi:hypothetical protein
MGFLFNFDLIPSTFTYENQHISYKKVNKHKNLNN